MKKTKVKVGDVCAIPLGDGDYAYAQIIDDSNQHCYIVYNYKSKNFSELQDLTKNKIIILTYTVDVFIENHRWPLLGNITLPSGIIFPNYIEGRLRGGKLRIIVVDHHANYIREASIEDKKKLFFKSSVSPIILEDVTKFKLLGIGRYRPYMDEMFYGAASE